MAEATRLVLRTASGAGAVAPAGIAVAPVSITGTSGSKMMSAGGVKPGSCGWLIVQLRSCAAQLRAHGDKTLAEKPYWNAVSAKLLSLRECSFSGGWSRRISIERI